MAKVFVTCLGKHALRCHNSDCYEVSHADLDQGVVGQDASGVGHDVGGHNIFFWCI